MNVEVDGQALRFPDFLLVGAGKSGTTSLFLYLSSHPRIFIPDIKEPNFFCYWKENVPYQDSGPFLAINDAYKYGGLFSAAKPGQILGEASAIYIFYYKRTIRSIKETYGQQAKRLKITAILRDPVEKLFSGFLWRAGFGDQKLDAGAQLKEMEDKAKAGRRDEFNFLNSGFYYEAVKAFMENFPQTRIYLYEDLQQRPEWLVKDLFGFLGVDSGFVPPNIHKKYNVTTVPRFALVNKILRKPRIVSSWFPPIKKIMPLEMRVSMIERLQRLNSKPKPGVDPETRARLKGIFREDILKLQDLIGRDLSKWLNF